MKLLNVAILQMRSRNQEMERNICTIIEKMKEAK